MIFICRDSPSSYRRKDSMGQSTISTHNRSESATIGKQNRYQTTTLTRFGDSLSHRNPYPVSPLSNATFMRLFDNQPMHFSKHRSLFLCAISNILNYSYNLDSNPSKQ